MTRLALLALIASVAMLSSTAAQDLAPQIVIPVPGTAQNVLPDIVQPDDRVALTAVAVEKDITPVAPEPPQVSPLIPLSPTGAPVPFDGPIQPVDQALSMPRDVPVPKVSEPVQWMMPIVPLPGQAVFGNRMGAGLSQPGILRLTGELASVETHMILPEGVLPTTELVLMLRSSVNNHPRDTRVDVEINGAKAGTVTIDNMGTFKEYRLAPVGLVPGDNRIRFTVQQAHRIFCGAQTSFGIWTEIDLGTSGIPVSPDALALTPAGLIAALQSQAVGGQAIEVLADEAADDAVIRDVSRRLGDALGYAPRLEILPFYAENMDDTARARIAIVPGDVARTTIRRGTGDAIVLQIEYNPADVPDLAAILPAMDAAPAIASLTPGVATPLSALATPTFVGNTYYFRKDVSFLLPTEWLLLASQKAEIQLRYGFSEDLPKGSLLLVKMNGITIQSLPLDKDGGNIRPLLQIRFMANLLDPGLNSLTFEMAVPGEPPSMPCMPRDTDILAVMDDTTIFVPTSPMMRQVDLQESLALLDGRNTVAPVVVDGTQTRALGAELDFAAVITPMLTSSDSPVLHVVRPDSAGLIPLGNSGVTRRALQMLVNQRQLPQMAALAPAKPKDGSVTRVAFKLAADTLQAEGEGEGARQDQAPDAPSLMSRIADWLPSLDGVKGGIDRVKASVFPGGETLQTWIEGKSGQAILLQLDAANPGELWLLAGKDISTAELARQVDAFRRDGSVAGQAHVALLRHDGRWETWSDNRAPRLAEPLSVFNLREVLGNYAAWSPPLFTALTLIFALLSVTPAIIYVITTRRKGSRI